MEEVENSGRLPSPADLLIQRYIESKNGWSRFRKDVFDLSPRWQWWSLALIMRRLPPTNVLPYPKIAFADHLSEATPASKMLRQCLAPFRTDERAFEDLLDWLLFGFGDPKTTALDSSKAPRFRHFEESFRLKDLLDYPGDWLGHIYETEIASRSVRDATAFFSTPPPLCKAIAEMTMRDAPLTATVLEPCCGTGRLLLEASNYAVHLSGQDVNATVVKISTVNAWLYMPSVVIPCPEIGKSAAVTLDRTVTEAPASAPAPARVVAPTQSPEVISSDRSSHTTKGISTWTTPSLFPES